MENRRWNKGLEQSILTNAAIGEKLVTNGFVHELHFRICPCEPYETRAPQLAWY